MNKKIIGVTVGTPIKPQKIVDTTLHQAKEDSELATKEYVDGAVANAVGDLETLLGGI